MIISFYKSAGAVHISRFGSLTFKKYKHFRRNQHLFIRFIRERR